MNYEVIEKCHYAVVVRNGPCKGEEEPCRKPAAHRVWWEEDKSDAYPVCSKHFKLIQGHEAEQEAEQDRLEGESEARAAEEAYDRAQL